MDLQDPVLSLSTFFLSVDTFSRACWALAHARENSKHAISHMLQCFAALGLPSRIKTDNGPCFIGKDFVDFLQTWKISHSTGIPYNPRGQAIMKGYNHSSLN